jgi:hypothetical protein
MHARHAGNGDKFDSFKWLLTKDAIVLFSFFIFTEIMLIVKLTKPHFIRGTAPTPIEGQPVVKY